LEEGGEGGIINAEILNHSTEVTKPHLLLPISWGLGHHHQAGVILAVFCKNLGDLGNKTLNNRGRFFMQENTLSSKFAGLDESSPKQVLNFFPIRLGVSNRTAKTAKWSVVN
jgi:hypothetical protein